MIQHNLSFGEQNERHDGAMAIDVQLEEEA